VAIDPISCPAALPVIPLNSCRPMGVHKLNKCESPPRMRPCLPFQYLSSCQWRRVGRTSCKAATVAKMHPNFIGALSHVPVKAASGSGFLQFEWNWACAPGKQATFIPFPRPCLPGSLSPSLLPAFHKLAASSPARWGQRKSRSGPGEAPQHAVQGVDPS
jgi:hypothetical protein